MRPRGGHTQVRTARVLLSLAFLVLMAGPALSAVPPEPSTTTVPPTSNVSLSWFGLGEPWPDAGPRTLDARVDSVAVLAVAAGANSNVWATVASSVS